MEHIMNIYYWEKILSMPTQKGKHFGYTVFLEIPKNSFNCYCIIFKLPVIIRLCVRQIHCVIITIDARVTSCSVTHISIIKVSIHTAIMLVFFMKTLISLSLSRSHGKQSQIDSIFLFVPFLFFQ